MKLSDFYNRQPETKENLDTEDFPLELSEEAQMKKTNQVVMKKTFQLPMMDCTDKCKIYFKFKVKIFI